MTIQDNIAVVERYYYDIWNTKNLAAIAEVIAEPHKVHFPAGQAHRIESVQEWTDTAFTAFPDVQFTIEDLIAADDRVAVRWFYVGTHTGPFLGIPPTGIRVEDHGINFFRVSDGRITDIWVIQDSLGLLQQLGVIPRPGAPAVAAPAV